MNESIDENLSGNTELKNLPNAGGILAMGIISIVFAGLVGLILSIISLSLSGKAIRTYEANSSAYTESSYKNVKAGKVCAIIGLSISGLALLIILVAVAANA